MLLLGSQACIQDGEQTLGICIALGMHSEKCWNLVQSELGLRTYEQPWALQEPFTPQENILPSLKTEPVELLKLWE
jgi:hypothetical protein